jgi:ribonuclease BN (tRNA processing enzyme)
MRREAELDNLRRTWTSTVNATAGTNELFVLGSGSAFSIDRNCASLAVRARTGQTLVLDTGVGNGSLRALRRFGIPLDSIAAIFVSHQHNDHAAGFVTLMLHLRALDQPFHVFCRASVAAALTTVTNILLPGVLEAIGERIHWHECEPFQESALVQGDVRLRFLPVAHLIDALGVQVSIGATALAYSGDTRPSAEFAEAARGSQLLIHEATELASQDGLASDRPGTGHSTGAEAGRVAALVGCERLLLTHVGDASPERVALLLDEAGRAFPGGTVDVARDDLRLQL